MAGLIPVVVAAAWIPVRDDLPNTDVALVLVLCVGAAAMIGGRWAYVIGALGGAAAFDFFDAPPYGQLYMTRGRDVVTTLVLVAVGLLVGELCVRLCSYRLMATKRGEDFTVMSSAARLMAEDPSMVVQALAGELVSRLRLADCEFEYGALVPGRAYVARATGPWSIPFHPGTVALWKKSSYPYGPGPRWSGATTCACCPAPLHRPTVWWLQLASPNRPERRSPAALPSRRRRLSDPAGCDWSARPLPTRLQGPREVRNQG